MAGSNEGKKPGSFESLLKGGAVERTSLVMRGLPEKSSEKSLTAFVSEEIDKPVESVVSARSEYVKLACDVIDASPFQVKPRDEARIESLQQSIAETDGELTSPVVVREKADGRFELIAGHDRLESYKLSGMTSIPAVIRKMDDVQAARALAVDNLARTNLPDYIIYKQIRVLFDNGAVASNSAVAKLIGKNRVDVIRYLAFGDLPERVHDLLKLNPEFIGGNTADALKKIRAEGGCDNIMVEGCQKLFDGTIKTQQKMLDWVVGEILSSKQGADKKSRDTAKDFALTDDRGKPLGKVEFNTAKGVVKISSKNLDLEKLQSLLREHLQTCFIK